MLVLAIDFSVGEWRIRGVNPLNQLVLSVVKNPGFPSSLALLLHLGEDDLFVAV